MGHYCSKCTAFRFRVMKRFWNRLLVRAVNILNVTPLNCRHKMDHRTKTKKLEDKTQD